MSAPESQPAGRTRGGEPAESPPDRGERWDDDLDYFECIKEHCSNGDVLYCYSPADNGGDPQRKADAAESAVHGCELNGRDALGPDTYYLFESDPDDSCEFAEDASRLVDSWTEIRDRGRDKTSDANTES